jgi:Zn-dependent protease with chaperone function
VAVAALALAVGAAGCLNAPISGRKQFVAIPEQEEIRQAAQAWQTVQSSEQPTRHTHYSEIVEQVGRRIAAVAGRPDYDWEFAVFASPEANAFALPGGKVAVYEGLLPICENEAGLAVVLSHEIAHVLARHGGERMSQAAAVSAGGGLIGKAIREKNANEQARWLGAYGAAAKYGVLLPYSRTHESEADSIGLTLMAQAGYDPSEAPRFWQRFANASAGHPPELLSTHPSDARRAAALQGLLPRAMAIYQAAPQQLGTGMAIAPAKETRSGGEIQLVHGTQERTPAIAPAAAIVTQPGANEFLPPIPRNRAAELTDPAHDAATGGIETGGIEAGGIEAGGIEAGAAEGTTGAEPAPFPSAPRAVDAGGWTPAGSPASSPPQ